MDSTRDLSGLGRLGRLRGLAKPLIEEFRLELMLTGRTLLVLESS